MHNSGFLYVATGRKFIDEAIRSVQTLRRHMPAVPACCFTDEPQLAQPWFDAVEKIENPHRNFFEKIPPLSRSPFQRTIFVDTDTIFAGSMVDVFDLLERFEIAAVPDPFWCVFPDTPAAFQHLNTGLIAYQNTERVHGFFRQWFTQYENEFNAANRPKHFHDQASFQRVLYRSDLRLYLLPPEYNLRLTCPQLVRIWAPVKMLHARHSDLEDLSRRVNRKSDVRLIWPNARHFARSDVFLISRRADALLRLWMSVPKLLLKIFLRSSRPTPTKSAAASKVCSPTTLPASGTGT